MCVEGRLLRLGDKRHHPSSIQAIDPIAGLAVGHPFRKGGEVADDRPHAGRHRLAKARRRDVGPGNRDRPQPGTEEPACPLKGTSPSIRTSPSSPCDVMGTDPREVIGIAAATWRWDHAYPFMATPDHASRWSEWRIAGRRSR